MDAADLRARLEAELAGTITAKARGHVITIREFEEAHPLAKACISLCHGGSEAAPAPSELLAPLP